MRIGSEHGLRLQQPLMDILSNNIANVNTPGYKGSSVSFAEAFAYEERIANQAHYGASPLGSSSPEQIRSMYQGSRLNLMQGTIMDTGNSLDLAIEGNGFFQVVMQDGQEGFTRAGAFQLDSKGYLVTSEGHLVSPEIQLPNDVQDLSIQADGSIVGIVDGEKTVIGQIELAFFENPDGLQQLGDNLFRATESSGKPQTEIPGVGEMGILRVGALESSNVDLITEMTNLTQAQRAYQMEAKLIKQSEEMWQLANALRR